MIPLRDSVRPKSFPFINYSLIILNIYVFYKQLQLFPDELEPFLQTYGVIPAKMAELSPWLLLSGQWEPFLPFVTSLFLHGSLLHIGGNMLYLWVFGDNVEDRLGHFRYLLFYLIAGIAGSLAHIYFNPDSSVPTIGASGAIAGVLGAYFLAFPKARVLALVPIAFFVTITEVRAVFFLFLWFILQVLNGLTALGVGRNAQMVAWWAHIGGFAAGAFFFKFFTRKR